MPDRRRRRSSARCRRPPGSLAPVAAGARHRARRARHPAGGAPPPDLRRPFDSDETRRALAGTGIASPRRSATTPACSSTGGASTSTPTARRRPRPGGPLQGRRVVITGASSGIGRETALKVARAGGVPLLVARRTEELEEVQAEIERDGGQAWVYSCDITDGESVDTLVKAMLNDHARARHRHRHAGQQRRPLDPPLACASSSTASTTSSARWRSTTSARCG